MGNHVLDIEGLSVRLEGEPVLRNTSLRVSPGEHVVLLGPNGAGKTTLLRAVLGFVKPEEGRVLLKGVSSKNRSRREIAKICAYVPQEHPETVPFTVRKFLTMSRYPYRFTHPKEDERGERVIRRVLDATGLEPFADRPVHQLSGGERRKVLIASALVQEPDLLVLDEVTIFLDPHHRGEIRDLLRREHEKRGTTLFSATNDVNQALLHGDRILVLDEGEVVFDGTSSALIESNVPGDVYGIDTHCMTHPTTERPMIAPITSDQPESTSS